MTKPTAYSYLRFSSPEQAKGDSLRRQTELRDAWLKRTGAVLDTTLTLRDSGVSAFAGKHRRNPDRHALAGFLELVKAGRIPKGSYLIVESLDRLSREEVDDATELFLSLTNAGVRVVQLLPAETVYQKPVNSLHLVMAIMELSRGHSESAMKSERCGRAWREKKRRAAAEKVPITAVVPSWLRVEGGRFAVVGPAAETVRRIFRLATDGYGLTAVTKKLNAEGVPPIGRADYWARSYVAKILGNRAVYGEYQPHTGDRSPDRKPDGPPVPGYFPAVVTEEQFHAARAALASRRRKAGRPGKRVNVFSGLLKDARVGGSIHVAARAEVKGGGTYMVSYKGVQGVGGARYAAFPFEPFERAVLSRLAEVDPREVLPRADRSADRVLSLAGRLADLDSRAAKLKAKLVGGDGDLDIVVDAARQVDADRKAVAGELAEARQEAASPLAEAWGGFGSLWSAVGNAPDPIDARVRLRSVLRRMVSEVRVLFVPAGRVRLAAVQVFFAGGDHSRSYLIRYEQAVANRSARREGTTEVRSFARKVGRADLDLRKPDHAAALERILPEVAGVGR